MEKGLPSILIVEDEIIISMEMKMILNDLGYNVCDTVDKGENVIDIVDKCRPDLILMDITLKGNMNGIEVASELYEKKYDTPIIYISAEISKERMEKVKKPNTYGFLVKPVKEDSVYTAVEIALEKYELEKKLKRTAEVLSKAQNIASLGSFTYYPDIQLVKGSDELFNIFDVSRDEPLFDNFAKSLHPDDKDYVLSNIQKAVDGGTYNIIHRLLLKDNNIKWVHAIGEYARDKDKNTVVGVVQDITTRKNAENRLEEANEKLEETNEELEETNEELEKTNEELEGTNRELEEREVVIQENSKKIENILNGISEAFLSLDNHFRITYFNKNAEMFLNRKKEEVMGKHLFDAFPEAKGSIFEEKYTYAINEKVPLSFKVYFDVKPYDKWYEVKVYPNEDGISIFFQIETDVDKIERKELQSRIEDTEALMRSILDHSPAIIYIKDTSGKFLFISKKFEELFKISPSEVVGKTVYDFIPENLANLYSRNDTEVLRTQKPTNFEEQAFYNDEAHKFLTIKFPVYRRNEIIGIGGISYDITEKEEILRQLERTNEEFEQANEELEQTNEELEQTNEELEEANEELEQTNEELEQTNEELEEANRKLEIFKILTENSSDIMNILEADGSIIFESDAVKRILGYEAGNRVGLKAFEFVHPDDVEYVTQKFAELLQEKNNVVIVEFRFKHEDGSWVWLETCGKNMLYDPAINGIVINSRDVSDRKLLEQELIEKHDLLNETSKLAKVGGWEFDPETGNQIWTEQTYNIHGVDFDFKPTVEKGIRFFCKEHISIIEKAVQEISENGKPFNLDLKLITKKGQEKWVRAIGRAVKEKGKIKKIKGTIQDITNVKNYQFKIEQQVKLIDLIHDAIIATDKDFMISSWNKGAERIYGFKEEEVLGKSIIEVTKMEFINDNLDNVVKKFFEKGVWINEVFQRNKNGDKLYIYSSVNLIKEDNEIIGAVAVNRDITKWKRTERELAQKLNYEISLAECSRHLLLYKNKNNTIKKVLNILLNVSGVSRVYIFENFTDSKNELCMKQTYEVTTSPDIAEEDNPTLLHLPYKNGFERWRKILSQGKEINGIVKTFPDEERAILEPQAILSILVLPIFKDDEWVGFIGFDDIKTERVWEESELMLLRMSSEMIGAYFKQQQFEQTLKESEERFRKIFKDDQLPKLMIDPKNGRIIDANNSAYKFYGYENLTSMKIQEINQLSPDEIRDLIKKVENKKKNYFQFKHKISTGEVKDVEVYSTSLQFKTGNLLFSIIHDVTERRKAEKAVKESEEIFRLAFENVNSGMCLVDFSGKFIQVNTAMCSIFGYSKEEFKDLTVNSITHPDYVDVYPDFIKKSLNGEVEGSTYEKLYCGKDGRLIWGIVNATLVKDYDKKPLYFIAHVQDITERKEFEELISQKNIHMELAQKMAKIGYWSFDIKTGLAKWSKMMFTILGYDPKKGEPSYDDHRKFIHPDDWENFDRVVKKAVEGVPYNMELRIIFPDGSLHYVIAHADPQYNEKGEIISLFGTTQDITERKKAEQKLKESEEKYRSLTENSKDYIMRYDKDCRHIYVNKSATEITGLTYEEFVGKKHRDIDMFPADLCDMWEQEIKLVFSTKKPRSKQFNWTAIDGDTYYLDWRLFPEFSPDGNVKTVLGVSRDITYIREIEIRLKEYINKLEVSNKELENFAHIIAHDLKNPLNAIISGLRLLQKKADMDNESKEEINSLMLAKVYQLTNQIDNMLKYSKLSRVTRKFNYIKFNKIINNVLNSLDSFIKDRDAQIKFSNTDVEVYVDNSLLEVLMQNLLHNAVKYCEKKPEILVSAENRNNEWLFSVKDNGIGIDMKRYKRELFKIFNRLSVDKDKYEGSGIGLASCKRIIDIHGGKIWVDSEPGKGSTFYFTIPKLDKIPN